uniref:DUF6816 domain-containing protein n=1 Tax=Odontella aurita TaxID=265563 RepID=A0A7S4M4J1_9STRA
MAPPRLVAVVICALLGASESLAPSHLATSRLFASTDTFAGIDEREGVALVPRRDVLLGTAAAALLSAAAAAPAPASASGLPPGISSSAPPSGFALPPGAVPPPGTPMMGRGGVPGPRVEGIGGGFDVQSPPPSAVASPDVIYPASLLGSWSVARTRTATEGDLGQAGVAWRLMGGGDDRKFAEGLDEKYDVRYVEAPPSSGAGAEYVFEGKKMRGVVLDRGDELSSRKSAKFSSDVRWDVNNPNFLRYVDGFGEPVELAVVQRRVEPPSSEAGFGSDELVRITASPGGLLKSAAGPVVRAARVRRRFRRGFDADGNRIVEGLEIVTTYRVLDGIAGVEMPTSTTKSRLRMTRQ